MCERCTVRYSGVCVAQQRASFPGVLGSGILGSSARGGGQLPCVSAAVHTKYACSVPLR